MDGQRKGKTFCRGRNAVSNCFCCCCYDGGAVRVAAYVVRYGDLSIIGTYYFQIRVFKKIYQLLEDNLSSNTFSKV